MNARRVIWKYVLDLPDMTVLMPVDAQVVGFGHQGGQLALWACVDPDASKTLRSFQVVGTGQEHESGWTHRGLVQMPNGLVWHLLESS